MKLYGYQESSDELSELIQVTIQAEPERLRRIADFLVSCANEIESNDFFEHEHLKDFLDIEDNSHPDLIVYYEG